MIELNGMEKKVRYKNRSNLLLYKVVVRIQGKKNWLSARIVEGQGIQYYLSNE